MALSGMGRMPATAGVRYVRLRPLLATLVGVLCIVAFVGVAATATAGRTCVMDPRAGGYTASSTDRTRSVT